MLARLQEFFKANQKDIILFVGIVLISLSSFALGRLTAPRPEKTPITFSEYDLGKMFFAATSSRVGESVEKIFVASKNGKYYHFSWCPGAGQMKEANKVWFKAAQEAKAAGYKPAPNCPGLENQ